MKFFDNVKKNEYYKLWLKDAWPYLTAAILLSVFQILTIAVTRNPWGVSAVFANWGAWIFESLGGSVDKWYYFARESAWTTIDGGFVRDPGSWRNIGIIVGALFAALIASGFKIKKIKSWRQVVAAILGGIFMGYGARIGFGCNIGALFSGIASFSLSGWVFGLAMFFGAVVGSKMLVKYFM
ncbi:MAG: YeeE/YedE family protein [Spirochaetales bacterium]|nr:YeeE/YedE family protein [Spirochaetales bacterium]MCF7937282.1 YeeE/YedE family protein [Spirochaetales bacterium]